MGNHQPRNIAVLIGWGVVWTIVFWVAGLFLAGMIAGMLDPENAKEAGEAVGRNFVGPLFLLAILFSVILVVNGVLPGTKKKPLSDEPAAFRSPAGYRDTGSDKISQLERLADLRAKGALTEEEYAVQKALILRSMN